jgi:predicted Zn-dependent protease
MLYLNTRRIKESFEVQKALSAADGYIWLGLPEEALEELNGLHPRKRKNAGVIAMRIRALLHLKRWEESAQLAERALNNYPEENEFTVQRAFALHKMRKGDEAIQVMLSAPEWIRRTGILHYNLACYEAQLGDLKTARQCIRAAIELNVAFKKSARKDPDLQRLWN